MAKRRTDLPRMQKQSGDPQERTQDFTVRAHDGIINGISLLHKKMPKYLENLVQELTSKFEAMDIKAEIFPRERTPFEIWSHWSSPEGQGTPIVHLLFTATVVTDSLEDCYRAMGIIHTNFPAVPGRFRDFISTPREDGYTSIDTAIIGPGDQHPRIEFKVRTKEMHDNASSIERISDDPYALHLAMLDRIQELEKALASLPAPIPGIGHNQPPEAIELRPLEDRDRATILGILAELKVQPAIPQAHPDEINAKSRRLKTFGEAVLAYVADKTDVFASEAAKSAGKEFGKWAARLAIWSALGTLLISVSQAVLEWIRVASLMF